MQNLVTLKDGEPRVSTLSIAEYVDVSHKAVIQLVRKHQIEFGGFGTLPFEMAKSGGRPTEHANLNEPQTTLLLTFLRNTERVKECKVRIVKEFFEFKRFGFLGFEIQEKRGTQGSPTQFAHLNEPQTTRAHAREKQGVSNAN